MFRFRFATCLAAAVLFCAAPVLSAQSADNSNTQDHSAAWNDADAVDMNHSFSAGGHLKLDMNVGEVRILPSRDTQVLRLVIESKDGYSQQEMRNMVKHFDVSGANASIRLEFPKNNHHARHNGFTVTIYVPEETGLEASLSVGQLTVSGIRGDKRLDVGVGQLQLNAVNSSDYYRVEADCGIGDVSDDVFHAKQSGWLGKSEKATGHGKYVLKVHVSVGEVSFMREQAAL